MLVSRRKKKVIQPIFWALERSWRLPYSKNPFNWCLWESSVWHSPYWHCLNIVVAAMSPTLRPDLHTMSGNVKLEIISDKIIPSSIYFLIFNRHSKFSSWFSPRVLLESLIGLWWEGEKASSFQDVAGELNLVLLWGTLEGRQLVLLQGRQCSPVRWSAIDRPNHLKAGWPDAWI